MASPLWLCEDSHTAVNYHVYAETAYGMRLVATIHVDDLYELLPREQWDWINELERDDFPVRLNEWSLHEESWKPEGTAS